MKYTFYLAYPKAEKSPIMMALRDGKKRITFALGITIDTEFWDKNSFSVTKQYSDYRLANQRIKESEQSIKKAITLGELDGLDIEDVANRYRVEMGITEKSTKKEAELFLPFYKLWATTSIGKHQANRQTIYRYRTIERYLKKLNPKFDEVDYKLYIYLLSCFDDDNYKLNMQGTFIKDIKAAMNEAYKRGLHDNRAYLTFTKPSEEVVTVALTKEEVERIYHLQLTNGMDKARDLFLIGCYTGLRFSDYSRLTQDEVKGDFIVKIQKKTRKEVCVPIHPRVREIVNKWGGSPDISQGKLNAYIKMICEMAKIDDRVEVQERGKISVKQKWEMVSTHTARRTAATNLLLSGATIHEVMRFLGHSTVTQTERYLRITNKENAQILAKNKFFSE